MGKNWVKIGLKMGKNELKLIEIDLYGLKMG